MTKQIEQLMKRADQYARCNAATTACGAADAREFLHTELEAALKDCRNAALEEAAAKAGEYAQKWWSKHCASNKHLETTREAHEDFCALQNQIRSMK